MSGLKLAVGKFYRTRDGRKVGPITSVNETDGVAYFPSRHDGEITCWPSGHIRLQKRPCDGDLIAEWTDAPTGPVRTVTRKEIVEGRYGDVIVNESDVSVAWMNTADKVRAAIATLTEIADALEDQA